MCDDNDIEILCDICAGIVSCCCCYWFYAIRFEQPPKKTAVIGSEKSQSQDYVPNPTVASMVPKPPLTAERKPSLGQKIMAAARKKSSMALRVQRSEISGNGFIIPQNRLNLVSERSSQMEAIKRQSWSKNIMDTTRKQSTLLPHLNISEKKMMSLQRAIIFQEPTSNSPNNSHSNSPNNKNPFKKSKKNKLQITNEINRRFSYKNANPDINYYNDRISNNSNDVDNEAKQSFQPILLNDTRLESNRNIVDKSANNS